MQKEQQIDNQKFKNNIITTTEEVKIETEDYTNIVNKQLKEILKDKRWENMDVESLNETIIATLNSIQKLETEMVQEGKMENTEKDVVSELYKKRYQLTRKKQKTQTDKTELNIISKATKIKRKERRE